MHSEYVEMMSGGVGVSHFSKFMHAYANCRLQWLSAGDEACRGEVMAGLDTELRQRPTTVQRTSFYGRAFEVTSHLSHFEKNPPCVDGPATHPWAKAGDDLVASCMN